MAVADSSGPERVCAGCGVIFRQSTPFGRALYCSVECRDTAYAEQRKRKAKVRSRDESGKFIWTEKKVE
jgi:hypothetical protein